MKKILSWVLIRVICIVIMIGIFLLLGGKTGAYPYVSARSAILINATTGSVLFESNAYEKRAMASTTKIMTALLTIEAGNPDTLFTVDSYAIRVEGTSMGLRDGDIVSRRALCYGMLLPSGNDAANAAAVSVSGSMSEFVKLMNSRAEQLGMTDTHFANPSGLDADGHYSTAYDMAILAKAALENEEFRKICCLDEAEVEFGNPPYPRNLYNSNKLLWNYDSCIGVKTGFTDNARRCLVSAAERDGVRIIAVTLNAPDDWNDHANMLDYGYTQLESTEINVFAGKKTLPVVGGDCEEIAVVQADNIPLALTDEERSRVEIKVYLEHFVYGGFSKGTSVGEAVVCLDGEIIGGTRLVTAEPSAVSVGELSLWEKIVRAIAG